MRDMQFGGGLVEALGVDVPETTLIFATLQLVRRAGMISVLPHTIIAEAIERGELVRLPFRLDNPLELYGIIRRRREPLSANTEDFAGSVREFVKNKPAIWRPTSARHHEQILALCQPIDSENGAKTRACGGPAPPKGEGVDRSRTPGHVSFQNIVNPACTFKNAGTEGAFQKIRNVPIRLTCHQPSYKMQILYSSFTFIGS